MEKRSGVVLRHIKTGLYYDRFTEHTSKLWAAWRFPDRDHVSVWAEASMYAPDMAEYEIVPVTLTIELE